MANPYNPSLLPRTHFRAPRVPFDFRAVVFAALGYLVWWAGDALWSGIFDKASVSGSFLAWLNGLLRGIPYLGAGVETTLATVFHMDTYDAGKGGYTFWHDLLGGAWFVGVWTFVTLGVARIAALRIARDEGLSLGAAFRFALKNWTTLLFVPLIVGGIIGLFVGCNALAGLVLSIPYVGQLFSIILIPLAAISTLLILLVALGGLVGFPLIGAAAAWEVNGSLDAVSRAFSYVFARPLQYFWNYFLIFLFTGVIILVGQWFTHTLTHTVDFGVLRDNLSMTTVTPDTEQLKDYVETERAQYDSLKDATGYIPGQPAPHGQPFAKDIQTITKVSWGDWLTTLMWWLTLNVIWIVFFGYAVFYLIGASASVYADLREDVDGTEEDEIWVEEDDADLDALAEGGPAEEAPAAPPPPASPSTPATDGDGTAGDGGDDA
jgi:hypothetical protein